MGRKNRFLSVLMMAAAIPLGAQQAQSLVHKGIVSFKAGDSAAAQSYFTSAEFDADKSLLQTIALYKAELVVQSEKNTAAGATKAAAILADYAAKSKLSVSDALFGTYRVSQARFAGLSGDWKNCETFADAALTTKDASIKKTATYWKALSLYQTEKYAKACKAVEANKDALRDDETLLVYAKSLAKAGKTNDALSVFADVDSRAGLDNAARLDYARTLLHAGKLSAAGEQAAKADGAEARYLQGIVAFNQRKWEDAASLMTTAQQAKPALKETYAAYAQFYAGYAQYRAGSYGVAYTTLTQFAEKNPLHPLRYDALMTASRSAVQSNQAEKSFALAEQAIYAASTDEQQNEAVLLAAGVYTDAGRYDKAIAILTPRANGRNQFAYQCRYELARIQALQQNYTAADKTYAELANDRLAGSYGEEAAYRRGELQYSQGNYAQAAALFEHYTQKWNGGQFADAALYFNADSLAKTGQTDKAILYFMQVDNLRQSTYKYNAEKNLVALYQAQGDYAQALQYARKLLANYGDQARDDGVAKTIDELEQLNKGGNSALVKKEKEYERAGKDTTVNGRAIGTELAQLYASASDTRAKGIALAEQLLPKQTAAAESQYAGQNALLLAQYYRTNGNNKKAAETYLSAAQYARAAGNDDNAARSLYGAAEAFDAAGLTGDAKAAADSLAQLYPASPLVTAARQIVNK